MRRGLVISLIVCGSCVSMAGCGEISEASLPERPTAADVQELVFTTACATSGCHSEPTFAGDLDLSAASTSHEALVDTEPTNRVARNLGLIRVVPGDPDSSFLFRKLTEPGTGEGAPMPSSQTRLTAPYVDLVARWISQGAVP